VQVYTGGYIDGQDVAPSGRTIRPGDGVAIETEHLSYSPNRPSFPSTVLRPGQMYHSTTIWRFGVLKSAGNVRR
jgi:aldose 1-epimerase